MLYGANCKCQNNVYDYLGQELPGNTPRVFAPGIVSTNGNNEHTLSFSHNGTEIYFTRDPERNTYVVRKTDDGWLQPEQAHFNGREAIFSASGEKLLFNDGDIWQIDYANNPLGQPIKIAGIINTPRYEYYASISSKGNLYFSRRDDDFAQ